MTRDEIIRMAREAWGTGHEIFWFDDDGLERFAALVARAEREACAQLCEQVTKQYNVHSNFMCASAIRARGEK